MVNWPFWTLPTNEMGKEGTASCSKLSMDDVGNLVNHSLAAPLRVVGKEWHNISLGGCWRPSVILKVLRWSNGSFNPSNGSSWGRWNFGGTEHSWTAKVNGEFVFLTILSRLWSIFPLMHSLARPSPFSSFWEDLSLLLRECRVVSYGWSPSSYLFVTAVASSLGFAW